MNVLLILALPLLMILLLMVVRFTHWIKWLSLGGSVLQLIVSILLWRFYVSAKQQTPSLPFLFEKNYPLFTSWNIQLHVGIDGVSIAMILLTSFVLIAGILISWNIEKMTKEFYCMLWMLSLGAYGFFISLDLFLLFFFLELAVIPKYLLIGIWGSGKKENSANKLALLLMFGSALVLVGMLILYTQGGQTFDWMKLAQFSFSPSTQAIAFPLLFVGFGIFTAIFPFHTWVPDGHSSAPTAGSMFLAGISMKLGGYGCFRVAMFLLPLGAIHYANWIIIVATIAIVYGGFATMMQKDLKYMNAYSSISHCGFVLLGLGMLTKTALNGAMMQMVSHGVMTALFFAVIGIIYERTHTRQVNEMGGLLKVMPFTITMLFLVGLCSLGLPGLSGFAAEMTIFVGAWENTSTWHRVATIGAILSIVITAVYILRAIGHVAMGSIREEHLTIQDARWNEKAAVLLLLVGVLSIGLAPYWLQQLVEPTSVWMMEKINVVTK